MNINATPPPMPDNTPHGTDPSGTEYFNISPTALESAATDLIALRRLSAFILCAVMSALLIIALFINWKEQDFQLIPPLGLALAAPLIAVIWLRVQKNALGPLYLLTGALALLGSYLLLKASAPGTSSLFWFIIFPSMTMFSMGILHGTIMCAAFFLFLIVAFTGPLESMLTVPLTPEEKYRFIVAMFGAFVFSWCAEYSRYITRKALNTTLRRLEKEALTDTLTGLGNRRDFHISFAWLLAHSSRSGSPFSLAIMDLDRFKTVNDRYGHTVGDKLLHQAAETLCRHKRNADRLFRWGGEEFILLMPNSDAESARIVAERMRAAIEATPFQEEGLTIPYTVSIGLYSGYAEMGKEDQDGPLREADNKLYAAKNAGRNRVME